MLNSVRINLPTNNADPIIDAEPSEQIRVQKLLSFRKSYLHM